MRIECHYNRRSIRRMGMTRGCRNDRLMAAMHAVKNADGEKEGPGKV